MTDHDAGTEDVSTEQNSLTASDRTEEAPGDHRSVLAKGGFTADTEFMTAEGPVAATALEPGDRVYSLDPLTGVAKPQPLTKVEVVSHDGELIVLETRRCDLRVAPDHRIPYQPLGDGSYTRVRRARDLTEQTHYRFINEWACPDGERLEMVDVTDLTSEFEASVVPEDHGHTFQSKLPEGCNPCRYDSHTGYAFDAETFKQHQDAIEAISERVTVRSGPSHHRRPYRFDGDDFITFLGWFVTEGSVHWSTVRETAQVKIAQEHDANRAMIEALVKRMGICGPVNERRVGFGSQVYGYLLDDLCGTDSYTKRLPSLVWELPREQKQLLLDVLVRGDGNSRGTYYTVSDRLRDDILRLCLELGITPYYSQHGNKWTVSTSRVNSGFKSDRNVQRVDTDGPQPLYRLTLSDYSLVMAGRHGLFQWVGVSAVQ